MPFKSLEHLPGGPLLVTMNGHRAAISGVCAAPVMRGDSGKSTLCIVTSSWDKTLKSWNLESGGVLKTFDGHADKVLSVSMTADGQYIASGSADTTVRYEMMMMMMMMMTMMMMMMMMILMMVMMMRMCMERVQKIWFKKD